MGGGFFQSVGDIATLGMTKNIRDASKQQERALNRMSEMQQQQMDELKKQGPAPTMTSPDSNETETMRRKRLRALQAGLASTFKSNISGNASTIKPIASGKDTLG